MEKKDGFVGSEGYLRLFKVLKEKTDLLFKARKLHSKAYRLPNSVFYLVPYAVAASKPAYVTGRLLKFDQPDKIQDLYTTKVSYSVKKEESAYRHELYFMFDPASHVLAEDSSGGKLPAISSMIEFITFVMTPIASEHFPKHTFGCNVLSSSEKLENVLSSATGYKRIEAEVTYSNPSQLSRKMLSEIDRDHRDFQITNISHVEKASRDSIMLSPSKYARALMQLATSLGKVFIRYQADNKWQEYDSEKSPITERVHRYKTESEEEFEKNVFNAIQRARQRSNPSESS